MRGRRELRVGVALAVITATLGIAHAGAGALSPPAPEASAETVTGPTMLAAGDIATCEGSADEATAAILAADPAATVATLGDNVYPNGTAAEFANCYDPSWGQHKSRTKPSPGNHDYRTTGAAAYFNYFGDAAGDPAKGYYSYDVGDWHIVALNSNCTIVDCGASSDQVAWLRNDLEKNLGDCTLAYWHHPLFTSGAHVGDADLALVRPFWDALYEHGADVVLVGHDHDYERFARQTPTGSANAAYGIRQFVVGTGGAPLRPFDTVASNSEVREATTWGVLKLVLGERAYSWQFLSIEGQTFTDSGSESCHGAPDLAPPAEPTMTSSHGSDWSNDNTIEVTWSGASDSGSGVDGFSYEFSPDPTTTPDATKDAEETATGTTSSPLGDGQWWFHLRTRDNAGNWSAATHLGPFRIDTTAPANPTLSASHVEGDWSNDNTVVATWTGASDATSGVDGFSYSWTQLADSDPGTVKRLEESAASTTSDALPDGWWWFHLRTRDNAGNWSAPVHRGPFKIDTTAPTNPTLSSPSHQVGTWSNERTVVVQWNGEAGQNYSYAWSANESAIPDDFPEGTASSDAATLADGSWWFALRTRDVGGSWSGTTRLGPFLIDTTPPTTILTAGPPASTTASDAVFEFFASEAASHRCSLDGAPAADCSSPTRYSALALGAHVFRVRARDRAGNVEPAAVEYRWEIAAEPQPQPQPQPQPPPPVRPPAAAKACVVPRLIGRTLQRGRKLAAAAGCRLGTARSTYSRLVRKGIVISQRPRPGRRLRHGARVNVVLSRGLAPKARRRG